ncbi:hypothetical protein KAI78_10675 [bacterium]|nr:hypothetical protein [bacterium]
MIRAGLFLLVLLMAFAMNAFSDNWTVMIYLNGDNNLEEYAITDFMEISSAIGTSPNVNIVCQFDRHPGYDNAYGDWSDARRFYMTTDMTPSPENAILSLGEVNMGSPAVLSDFIKWSVSSFPADNYALILWDHGNSWYRFSGSDLSIDETNSDSLSIAGGEMRQALSDSGIILSLLGIDACISSTMTLASEVNGYAGFIAANEDYLSSYGWNYSPVINAVFDEDGVISPEELGLSFCREFYRHYEDNAASVEWNSMSLLRMSAYPAIVSSFNLFCSALLSDMELPLNDTDRLNKDRLMDVLHEYELWNNRGNSDMGNVLGAISEDTASFSLMVNTSASDALLQYEIFVSTSLGEHLTSSYKEVPSTGITINYINDPAYLESLTSSDLLWDEILFYKNSSEGFEISPNPCTGIFSISGLYSNDTVRIFTIAGSRFINRSDFETNKWDVDLSKYPDGIYIISIFSPVRRETYNYKLAKVAK